MLFLFFAVPHSGVAPGEGQGAIASLSELANPRRKVKNYSVPRRKILGATPGHIVYQNSYQVRFVMKLQDYTQNWHKHK